MVEIGKSGCDDLKNVKSNKNGARMYLQSSLKVEENPSYGVLQFSAMNEEDGHQF